MFCVALASGQFQQKTEMEKISMSGLPQQRTAKGSITWHARCSIYPNNNKKPGPDKGVGGLGDYLGREILRSAN